MVLINVKSSVTEKEESMDIVRTARGYMVAKGQRWFEKNYWFHKYVSHRKKTLNCLFNNITFGIIDGDFLDA